MCFLHYVSCKYDPQRGDKICFQLYKNLVERINAQRPSSYSFLQKRSGIYQIVTPFTHLDGDPVEIYVEEASDPGKVRLTDYGMALMRLSYASDPDEEFSAKNIKKPMFLFPVNTANRAKDVHGTILFLQNRRFVHRSVVVFENYEGISQSDHKKLMNVSDKEFASFSDFEADGEIYVKREAI